MVWLRTSCRGFDIGMRDTNFACAAMSVWYKIVSLPFKSQPQGRACTLNLTQVHIYTRVLLVHACTAGIGAYILRCPTSLGRPRPDAGAPEPTSTRMTRTAGSQADESLQSRNLREWVTAGSCTGVLAAILVCPRSAFGVRDSESPIYARNHMLGPAQRRRAPERAQRSPCHTSDTSYLSARYERKVRKDYNR